MAEAANAVAAAEEETAKGATIAGIIDIGAGILSLGNFGWPAAPATPASANPLQIGALY